MPPHFIPKLVPTRMLRLGGASAEPVPADTPAAPAEAPSLAERIAAAPPEERAALLRAAVEAGERVELPGADLRGIDLRSTGARRGGPGGGPDLLPEPVCLDRANLAGATLSGACLAGVSLRGACLDGALLVGADLRSADLSGASLREAFLTGATMARADLSFAVLRGASLLTADLTEVVATGADLQDTLAQSVTLTRAVLRAADLRWSRLEGATLAGAELDGVRFEGARLAMANLSGARLTPATDLSYAFLSQVRLDRVELTRAHVARGIGEAFTDLALARATYVRLKRHFEATGARAADARWAQRQEWRMDTATHRPDRARRYHRRPPERRLGEACGLARDREFGARARRVEGRRGRWWRVRVGGGARMGRLGRLAGRIGGLREGGVTVPLAGARRGLGAVAAPAAFHMAHATRFALGHLMEVTTGYGTSCWRLVATILATWLAFSVFYLHAGAVIDLNGAAVGIPELLHYSAATLTPIDAYPLVATSGAGQVASTLEGVAGMMLLGALGYVFISRVWGR